MNIILIELDSLKYKTPQRLKKIRNKYRRLKFTSHDLGAGGISDSSEYRAYDRIVQECDKLLKR